MTTQSVPATTRGVRAWIYGVMLVHEAAVRLRRGVQVERPADGNLILQLKMHSETFILWYRVSDVLHGE